MRNIEHKRAGRALLSVGALVALATLAGAAAFATPFTYVHVLGTGDPTPHDPHTPVDPPMDKTIAACDVGSVTELGLMTNVCSFDGDKNSNGGVYLPKGEAPYRSFRREDSLPGQKVGFEKAIIPFGYPVLHPKTGDTYLTAFFDPDGVGYSNLPGGREEGVYVYGYQDNVMRVIADTTTWSEPLPQGAVWTDFSTNVAVSEAGAFFVGDYKEGSTARQGIYRYVDGKLFEIVRDPASTRVPDKTIVFSRYRGVAANSSTVLFVGESLDCAKGRSGSCVKGVYAQDLATGKLATIIESGAGVPGGGTFLDFAIEPKTGIFHSSIAVNEAGDIVLVAGYRNGEDYQGVFLLENSGSGTTPTLILSSGVDDKSLLGSPIESFNTVAINSRSEIAFVVAGQSAPREPPEQGLVFYRDQTEGLRSVFKQGDTFLAELKHPSPEYETVGHGGVVSGSQALSSAEVPQIYFRHFYQLAGDPTVYSMMVLATLNE